MNRVIVSVSVKVRVRVSVRVKVRASVRPIDGWAHLRRLQIYTPWDVAWSMAVMLHEVRGWG